MIPKTASHRGIALACFLACLFLLGQPTPAEAGCGCDKPPPAPAAVIPSIAFAGLPVTLFHDSFQVGQRWTVDFRQGSSTVASVTASVVSKRDITDATGMTYKPQLVVPVPSSIPVGPTGILAYTAGAPYVSVPKESFTVIGKPVVISEQAADHKVKGYTTAVGYDGALLYISVGGLDRVCEAMEFEAFAIKYPLRIDGIVISNSQGFFIDSLSTESADHFFSIDQRGKANSDLLYYWRHSFETYCTDHQPGGAKEVDPEDPNWHKDGTPHVDYDTLIFAIAGHFDSGSVPEAGSVSFDLNVKTKVDEVHDEGWEHEEEEEDVGGGKKGGK